MFECFTAKEAKAVFTKEGDELDLIFSDVVLPDQNGVKLVEELSRMKPEVKILLSSGYTDQKSQWETNGKLLIIKNITSCTSPIL